MAIRRLQWSDLAWGIGLAAIVTVLIARNFFLGQPEFPLLKIGPVELSRYGSLSVLGILFGYYLVRRWCGRFGLDWNTLSRGLIWILVLGLYIAHLVWVAIDSPEAWADLAVLLDFRTGVFSFGAIFGGGVVAVAFLKWSGLPVWRYLDALVYGAVGGLVFGRAGAFAIHDHLGVATDFFLGVELWGTVRHDIGFYEMLLMLGLLVGLTLMASRVRPPDALPSAIVATVYALARFFFDSLRIYVPTYGGLTAGQWFSLLMLACALWAWYCVWSKRSRNNSHVQHGSS